MTARTAQAEDVQMRVLLCVTGGIAAYKAPELVRQLIQQGCEVRVLVTDAALAFVSELALSTVSRHAVRKSLLDIEEEGRVGHIELADWANVVLVAPATANTIAKMSTGIADDLVSTVLLATRASVVVAPAMNTNMWEHPATQDNVARLRARGVLFIGPATGELACGWTGAGKMVEPDSLAKQLVEIRRARRWGGRRVLVTAGPTRSYLDPARFISNASTGLMGVEMAKAFRLAGAEVFLVVGPITTALPQGIDTSTIETGSELQNEMTRIIRARAIDTVVMAAAVADLKPANPTSEKISKNELKRSFESIEWVEEPDILKGLCDAYAADVRFLGFAAETSDRRTPEGIENDLLDKARRKLERKGCHAVFVNRVGVPDSGMGSATNAGHLVFPAARNSQRESVASGPPVKKSELANWIVEALGAAWPESLSSK